MRGDDTGAFYMTNRYYAERPLDVNPGPRSLMNSP